ncbi:C-X-C motif chemokine 16 isoform X1 [Sciurus carolinensis]|uniref:C-X-C motif chemokine 16 isoform X1 n=2 Tax=Sciurus carolinensis TaxID=30640 RepID=UPI001FB4809D|nr:C-X-C motif chemokine 16 isoform X1 [Sciurus carolinensis]
MRRAWGPPFLALLFLLELLTLPGDGNEGSVTGSCLCGTRISSNLPPSLQTMDHFRKHLKAYSHCGLYIRFQLPLRNVCGRIQDPWVRELVGCFDRRECGPEHGGNVVNQEHLPFPSTPIPEPAGGTPPDMNTATQMYLPSIQQSTQQFKLPSGALPLDKELTHLNETTTFTVGYGLGTEFKVKENQRLKEEIAGTATEESAMVPVLSLLVIVFILTGVLLYLLCKRRREQSLQGSSDRQLHYTLVTPVSNACTKK